jgi:hypothetical protein
MWAQLRSFYVPDINYINVELEVAIYNPPTLLIIGTPQEFSSHSLVQEFKFSFPIIWEAAICSHHIQGAPTAIGAPD